MFKHQLLQLASNEADKTPYYDEVQTSVFIERENEQFQTPFFIEGENEQFQTPPVTVDGLQTPPFTATDYLYMEEFIDGIQTPSEF